MVLKMVILGLFSETEKCEPNPCHNNATCINDKIRFKCICPAAAEPETAIVGLSCNKCKFYVAPPML